MAIGWLVKTVVLFLVSIASAADQRTFLTAEEAARELVAAVKSNDTDALIMILGEEARPILSSGDVRADRRNREQFVRAYEERSNFEKSGYTNLVLVVGREAWPFPIPLTQTRVGWWFDAKAGTQEILHRRIGRNELAAVQVMKAYIDAQREYYLLNPENDKLLQYAQKLVSADGKRDGLYWPMRGNETPSPLGPLVGGADVATEGLPRDGREVSAPYYGYHYRILKAQGPNARGGAYSYLEQGRMIGGFALIAWPVVYAQTGVMTFIVNHDGLVYEKDLGTDTAVQAQNIAQFDPDKSWKRL